MTRYVLLLRGGLHEAKRLTTIYENRVFWGDQAIYVGGLHEAKRLTTMYENRGFWGDQAIYVEDDYQWRR